MNVLTIVQSRPNTSVKFYGEANPDKLAALVAYQTGNPLIVTSMTAKSDDGLHVTSTVVFKSPEDLTAYFTGMPADVKYAYTTERAAYNTANGITTS